MPLLPLFLFHWLLPFQRLPFHTLTSNCVFNFTLSHVQFFFKPTHILVLKRVYWDHAAAGKGLQQPLRKREMRMGIVLLNCHISHFSHLGRMWSAGRGSSRAQFLLEISEAGWLVMWCRSSKELKFIGDMRGE